MQIKQDSVCAVLSTVHLQNDLLTCSRATSGGRVRKGVCRVFCVFSNWILLGIRHFDEGSGAQGMVNTHLLNRSTCLCIRRLLFYNWGRHEKFSCGQGLQERTEKRTTDDTLWMMPESLRSGRWGPEAERTNNFYKTFWWVLGTSGNTLESQEKAKHRFGNLPFSPTPYGTQHYPGSSGSLRNDTLEVHSGHCVVMGGDIFAGLCESTWVLQVTRRAASLAEVANSQLSSCHSYSCVLRARADITNPS